MNAPAPDPAARPRRRLLSISLLLIPPALLFFAPWVEVRDAGAVVVYQTGGRAWRGGYSATGPAHERMGPVAAARWVALAGTTMSVTGLAVSLTRSTAARDRAMLAGGAVGFLALAAQVLAGFPVEAGAEPLVRSAAASGRALAVRLTVWPFVTMAACGLIVAAALWSRIRHTPAP